MSTTGSCKSENQDMSSMDQPATAVDVDHFLNENENENEKELEQDHEEDQLQDSADDLLWSDCTEELYLRRILAERQQQSDDFTLVDSVMGRSTVAEIFYNQRRSKDSSQDYHRDDASWTNFNPIAGSVATEATDPVDSSFSAEGNSTPSSTPEKKSPQPYNQEFRPPAVKVHREHREHREKEDATLDQDPLKSMFDPSILKYVDMDEESTGSIPQTRLPEEVDTFEYQYDEEEGTHVDGQATRSGLSTLTGDTTIRYLPPPGVPVHYDNPKWYSDVAQQYQQGQSSPYLDPNYTPKAKGSGRNQAKGAVRASSAKHRTKRKEQTQRTNNSAKNSNASNRSSRSSNKRDCCCARLIRRLTEDDKLFRRTVIIAVIFIIVFLALAVVALMQSGNLVFSRSDDGPPPDMQQPTQAPTPTNFFGFPTDAPASDNGSPPKPAQNLVNSVPAREPESTTTIVQPDPVESPDFQASDLITDPFRYISNLIFHRSRRSMQALGDQLSPQFQALRWVSDELTQEGRAIPSDDKIFQRWTLAVLYHSLNGPGWIRKDGWLTASDECTWFSTFSEPICDNAGLLVRLGLRNNGLLGRLPAEISVLPNTLAEISLEGNLLSGSIPSELGRLTSLLALNLGNNRFTGSIPSQLGNLADLEILDLSTNFLTGELHLNLFDLVNLESLILVGNQLSGRLSESIAQLGNLRFLELEGNDLTGMIPEAMCDRREDDGLLQIMTFDCNKIDCGCCDDIC